MTDSFFASITIGLVIIYGLRNSNSGNFQNIAVAANDKAAFIVSLIIALNVFLDGFTLMTVNTRLTYAMARDNALPFSN